MAFWNYILLFIDKCSKKIIELICQEQCLFVLVVFTHRFGNCLQSQSLSIATKIENICAPKSNTTTLPLLKNQFIFEDEFVMTFQSQKLVCTLQPM